MTWSQETFVLLQHRNVGTVMMYHSSVCLCKDFEKKSRSESGRGSTFPGGASIFFLFAGQFKSCPRMIQFKKYKTCTTCNIYSVCRICI